MTTLNDEKKLKKKSTQKSFDDLIVKNMSEEIVISNTITSETDKTIQGNETFLHQMFGKPRLDLLLHIIKEPITSELIKK